MIYTIEDIRRLAGPIIEKYRLPALYLFGSYARGCATEQSDLDFLVDTAGTGLTSLLRLGELYCDLEDVFGKRIDLVTVNGVMQGSLPSDESFREMLQKERVALHEVA